MFNLSNETLEGNLTWTRQSTAIYKVEIVAIPLLVIFGTVGNLLSIWVLTRSPLKGLSSSLYLAALAASDTGFLASLLVVWFEEIGLNLYNKSGWCQGITYLSCVTTFLSVWLVIAFTVERFLAVCYPLLRPSICTVKRAKSVVLYVCIVPSMLYSYLLVVAEPVVISGESLCQMKENYKIVVHVMNYVDTVLTLMVPVILVVGLNLAIVRCVWYVENLRQSDQEMDHKCTRQQLQVTKTLLIISTVFMVLNMPSYFVRAYLFFEVSSCPKIRRFSNTSNQRAVEHNGPDVQLFIQAAGRGGFLNQGCRVRWIFLPVGKNAQIPTSCLNCIDWVIDFSINVLRTGG